MYASILVSGQRQCVLQIVSRRPLWCANPWDVRRTSRTSMAAWDLTTDQVHRAPDALEVYATPIVTSSLRWEVQTANLNGKQSYYRERERERERAEYTA